MDSANRFPCILMHPGRFPATLLDPFNPPRIKLIVEIGPGKVSFSFAGSSNQAKTLISETFDKVQSVNVQPLSAGSRRLEILRKSLGRVLLVAAVLFVYLFISHLQQARDLIYTMLIALAAAVLVSGPLFFVFNGGLSSNTDVVRFHFNPLPPRKPFYLEVDSGSAAHLRQALISAGAKFEQAI